MIKKLMMVCLFSVMLPSIMRGDFTINPEGTVVTDMSTGLMWEIKTDDGSPQDKDNLYTWQEALSYCENLNLAGCDDWRLPNRNELQSIVDYGRRDPSINSIFPNTVSAHYWSSTSNVSSPNNAWLVNFYFGFVESGSKSNNSYVRAVRYCGTIDDYDCDEILNEDDNCTHTANSNQDDFYPPRGNGIGDACDCEGNFNCAVDQDVDGSDASTLKADFGRSNIVHPCISEDTCNGDFNCDGDVDGSDASLFKQDFGRSSLQNPCPACDVGSWCVYQ